MNRTPTWNRNAQLAVVVLCAALAKLYYSTASVNQLRWILAPTTTMVELVTGSQFEFESYAGYINSDRSFIIASSCAGVNFLITSFLMLSLRKLWRHKSQCQASNLAWSFVPAAAFFAYLATIVANTVRISTALRLRGMRPNVGWLDPTQLHRMEGIFIYFGFLLLLFVVSENISSDDSARPLDVSRLFGRSLFPLVIYYAITLGIPVLNGAYRPGTSGTKFWEHSLFVLLIPLLLILPLAAFQFRKDRNAATTE